ncbi:MAG: peptidoglycan-binding protein [Ruminococcaceae bacterium]|nr:peptidoglycan-binding protein [Oscillospiraceae bacterium]
MRNVMNESENIRELQRYLRELHHADPRIPLVNPDGIYGPETTAAVEEFQRLFGLPVTGRTDFATWQAIYAAYLAALENNAPPRPLAPFPEDGEYILRAGEYSDIVALVQFILRALADSFDDIDGGEPDGVLNDDTMADIRRFQARHGLPATGEVDKATWNALADAYNRQARSLDSQ